MQPRRMVALIALLAGCSDAAADSEAPILEGDLPRMRGACGFRAGDRAARTFGLTLTRAPIPIDTIVIVSQENRSFDEYFSQLPAYGQPDVDVAAADATLLDAMKRPQSRFHQTQYCFADTWHDWTSMHLDWNEGRNDGFVRQNDPDGVRALGWFDASDLAFYYDLAATYGISDAYFTDVMGPTCPNRLFLYAATSSGHIANGTRVAKGHTDIFQELGAARVPFAIYSAATMTGACAGPYSYETDAFCASIPGGARPLAQYFADAVAGSLPAVSWLYVGSDEHPSANMQIGESQVAEVFQALARSPQWAHAAFILTYDEDGGAYDHTPPPAACPPDNLAPNVPDEAVYPGAFDRYGFRVPLLVASPYSKPHYVSHVVHSHVSILRFLELRFDLPAMSARDANAEALLDFFDFSRANFAQPHIPPPVVIAPPEPRGCP
jgi:phospholipase C